MKGFVVTPQETVDLMVGLLFRRRTPKPDDAVLDPGCGNGAFIEGVIRWCDKQGISVPRIVGVESDPRHLPALHGKFAKRPEVRIEHSDFLRPSGECFQYIVGNPPYVPITGLSEAEKAQYRASYGTARGRFDLYLLFFEEAMRRLAPNGRLVFITPEKFLYVDTARPLRELLARLHVEEIRFVLEDTFRHLVTYPTITVLKHADPGVTRVVRRDGTKATVKLPSVGASWLPTIEGGVLRTEGPTLGDLCLRLSCGVATGADSVFVHPSVELGPALRRFAYPTIAGRELTSSTRDLTPKFAMLIPYDLDGQLLPLDELEAMKQYLLRDNIRRRLLARTCVKRKPWYAFHETPKLREILRPKILCKDIGMSPRFWVDWRGDIVPRHSVYYIVPKDPNAIEEIVGFLRSSAARAWLAGNCQRAANGFVRLQSRVLQKLPVPESIVPKATINCDLSRIHRTGVQGDLPLDSFAGGNG